MANETRIRAAILDALDSCHVSSLTDSLEREKFLSGTTDFEFRNLGLDSLDIMEFCISLEINRVYVITPEELRSVKSLNHLVAIIADSKS
jgi:acyl carrier protein